jgi:hypothetical protein
VSHPIWNLRSLPSAPDAPMIVTTVPTRSGITSGQFRCGCGFVGQGERIDAKPRLLMCVPAASVILASVPCPQPRPVNFQKVIDFVVTPG